MRQVEFVDTHPTVIHCNVDIIHPQLRDLLQPAGEKGKVLFINRLRIDCADFNTKKVPTPLCTLDFAAVCLTTGSGLVAAGGQQSELDIRPLLPLPTSSNEGSGETTSSTVGTNGSNRNTSSDQSASSRNFPRWHLRTPTGGSINNSICIQPDSSLSSSSSLTFSGVQLMGGPESSSEDKDNCLHREKRRKDVEGEMEGVEEVDSTWTRDGPDGRIEGGRGRLSAPLSRSGCLCLDTIVERNRIGVEACEEEKLRQMEEKKKSQRGQVFSNGLTCPSTGHSLGAGGSVRVLVSNNDQSVKEFRLRPPMKWRSGGGGNNSGTSAAAGERIESGLPGLSRLQTVEFPTCINHSSFSPDGRHLVSVGDTPEVFLYSVDGISGELTKIATYTASSDASFSTSWSPDGMRFAVASQDGFISIWDVRSACKIASLQTSQMADMRGSGAARVVKWSPRGDLLAYSEHTTYIHIIETATFTSSQKIRVPLGGTSPGRTTSCNPESVSSGNGSSNGTGSILNGYDVDDALHSSTDTTDAPTSGSALLESTSPARFATSGRTSAANIAANNLRPWTSARRYRDIGNNASSRSPLDRALLGEWSNSRRGVASHPEVYIDDIPTTTTTNTFAYRDAPTNSSTSTLIRTVDDIMATFEEETTGAQRGTGIWSLGSLSRRAHRSESSIDISGLTWDPDGEFLYVSTEDLIAQYSVHDLRRSFGQAVMR